MNKNLINNQNISPPINLIEVEVIINRLAAIPNLIDKDIARMAFSVLISEYKDYAVGILDSEGSLIAQCRGGLPIFIANALSAGVRDGLKIYGKKNLQNGDVVISNHAGTMGQHINNVVMYTPIRTSEDDDGLVGFSAIVMHWMDVGGMVVGSFLSDDSTDIFQEGIQFHTIKLLSNGNRVEEIFRMIECNTRFPEMVMGDLESQLVGCLMGRDMVLDVVNTFTKEAVLYAVNIFWNRSEESARKIIRAIPDGTYKASTFLDDDPQLPGVPIPINVEVIVDGDEITIDLSGLANQALGPINAGYQGGAVAAARIACKYMFSPEDPANEGAFRPIKVVCPPGKLLSAGPTAAMGGSGSTIPTVVDTIIKAMVPALPDRLPAAHHGTYGLYTISGKNENNKWFQHMESSAGGWGAGPGWDGTGPFRSVAHGDTLEVPVELQEAQYPYRLDYVKLREGSGGAGQFRGGLGLEKCYLTLANCKVGVKFERTICPPWGASGGHDGQSGKVEIHYSDGRKSVTVLKGELELVKGDRAVIFSAGGGGYGDPYQRSQTQIDHDLREGYVSVQEVKEKYKKS
jgi:N-methylhydantoinase B